MSRLSRLGFSLLLMLALVATAAVSSARRGDRARPRSATANMIRRLGVAVMYDDQQRRQQTSPQITEPQHTWDDGQL